MRAESRSVCGEGLEILDKVDAIISALAESGELPVTALAERVDEPVSSTYRLLSNLVAAGWVAAGSKRGLYRLGLFFMRIGGQVEDCIDIRERALPALQRLLAETGQTAYLCVRDRLRAVCIERLDGGDVRSMALRLGASLPLVIGGAPIAILSYLPQREYESVCEASVVPGRVEGLTRTREEIDAIVERTRELGVAVSDGDVTPGVSALGAPVFNHRGEIAAAISVSGIREHILGDEVREHAIAVAKSCADEVSAALGWHGVVVR